jgi:hypothetical protein
MGLRGRQRLDFKGLRCGSEEPNERDPCKKMRPDKRPPNKEVLALPHSQPTTDPVRVLGGGLICSVYGGGEVIRRLVGGYLTGPHAASPGSGAGIRRARPDEG